MTIHDEGRQPYLTDIDRKSHHIGKEEAIERKQPILSVILNV